MRLEGGPRLCGVWFDVYFLCSAYIRHLCYVISFSPVSVLLEQRPG
jgi:hypothetical protein